jgi:hypothetical protein
MWTKKVVDLQLRTFKILPIGLPHFQNYEQDPDITFVNNIISLVVRSSIRSSTYKLAGPGLIAATKYRGNMQHVHGGFMYGT